MKLDEPVGGDYRLAVAPGLVERVSAHQLALGRPHRVGMLTFHFVEGLGRGGVTLFDDLVHRLIVEIVDRLLDIGVFFGPATSGERADQCGGAEPTKHGYRTHQLFRSRQLAPYTMDHARGAKPRATLTRRRGLARLAIRPSPVGLPGRDWCNTRRRDRRTTPRAGVWYVHAPSARPGNVR